MNKIAAVCCLAVSAVSVLTGCQKDTSKIITVCASELPHAKILNECIKGLVEKDGYSLEVTVLDWSIQNDSLLNKEYDANYFQHVPYLKSYAKASELFPACKVHYEKLCLYASDKTKTTLNDGAKIELVNDTSNIERALQLLVSHQVLTISPSCYDSSGNFTFDTSNPDSCVIFLPAYAKCTLTCIKESLLCASLPDYDFGIIPGNTALTGLGADYASRIAFGEEPDASLISQKANIVCVRKEDKDSEKTKELVKAFSSSEVESYISTTFGASVLYHFENGLTTDLMA
jgi:D-methionine transport system substrate-binding protein